MSATTSATVPAKPDPVVIETSTAPAMQDIAIKNSDSLVSQQFILAIYLVTIVAGVLGVVVYRGDAAQVNLVLGFAFGIGVTVSGFYYGTSKSSQNKDAVIASKTP